MRILDILLQAWRARKARPWIRKGDRLLDIGCHKGEFLDSLGDYIGPSVGVDPLTEPASMPHYELMKMEFDGHALLPQNSFDAIVMLATLEHIPDKSTLARAVYRLLRPGGRIIITVPAPFVDSIVGVFRWLRLADGMSFEQHHGFLPRCTPQIFERHGMTLEHSSRFQLGLNYLFIFRKSPTE